MSLLSRAQLAAAIKQEMRFTEFLLRLLHFEELIIPLLKMLLEVPFILVGV